MRIKALTVLLLLSLVSSAQRSLEDYWTFDVHLGRPMLLGPMNETNSGVFKYQGLWAGSLGFSKYGTSGQFGKNDILGVNIGYFFQVNKGDASDLLLMNPTPATYQTSKANQLLHGPTFRVEYTRNGDFAPYIALGGHLLGLRGTVFELEFDPKDNLYQTVSYKNKALGGFNGCFSINGGLRYVLPGNWALSLDYELFLRQYWRVKYVSTAIPYVASEPELESEFILSQKGLNHQIRLRLQLPLN